MAAQQQQIPATVTVACKYPPGLVLRTFEMQEVDEPMFGGGFRRVKRAQFEPRVHVVSGPSHAQNKAPKSEIRDSFALTPGVPGDLWAKWLEQNNDSDIVRNGLIFAHAGDRDVRAEAQEKAGIKSGLERLDPKAMPPGLEAVQAKKV